MKRKFKNKTQLSSQISVMLHFIYQSTVSPDINRSLFLTLTLESYIWLRSFLSSSRELEIRRKTEVKQKQRIQRK